MILRKSVYGLKMGSFMCFIQQIAEVARTKKENGVQDFLHSGCCVLKRRQVGFKGLLVLSYFRSLTYIRHCRMYYLCRLCFSRKFSCVRQMPLG